MEDERRESSPPAEKLCCASGTTIEPGSKGTTNTPSECVRKSSLRIASISELSLKGFRSSEAAAEFFVDRFGEIESPTNAEELSSSSWGGTTSLRAVKQPKSKNTR